MTEEHKRPGFPSAGEDVGTGRRQALTPQTASPSYRLAFADDEFLVSDELRGVRLMLEYLKPQTVMSAEGIEETVVVFGSARVADTGAATGERSASCTLDSFYYREARRLAGLVSSSGSANPRPSLVIMTGGGPGIMEAANRGAQDVGARSVGLNVVLPKEQTPNPYITPELSFQFHYFAVRKLHFLLRARALVFFPGGFGTLDELFEALTLVQTGRMRPLPVLLFGEEFWRRVVDFSAMVDIGVIGAGDLDCLRFVKSAEEALAIIEAAS
ncbi:MAG TPA: LOG family protein [Gammaproteobacteria bacterium]|jgi:hypothetical protein